MKTRRYTSPALKTQFTTFTTSRARNSHCRPNWPLMALRRVLGIHVKLSAAARQCEAAHGRSLLGLGKGMPGLSTASTHSTAGHALRLAASTFAAETSSCMGRRTFVAQAAPSADTGSSVDLNFTDSAVEVSISENPELSWLPLAHQQICSSFFVLSRRIRTNPHLQPAAAEAWRASRGNVRPAAGSSADGRGWWLLRFHLSVRS